MNHNFPDGFLGRESVVPARKLAVPVTNVRLRMLTMVVPLSLFLLRLQPEADLAISPLAVP
jgi:hypothetical protein